MKQSTVDRIARAIIEYLPEHPTFAPEPALYAATALHVGPDDVVVIHAPQYTTQEQALATKAKAVEVFGTHRVMIISQPSTITVASFTATDKDQP